MVASEHRVMECAIPEPLSAYCVDDHLSPAAVAIKTQTYRAQKVRLPDAGHWRIGWIWLLEGLPAETTINGVFHLLALLSNFTGVGAGDFRLPEYDAKAEADTAAWARAERKGAKVTRPLVQDEAEARRRRLAADPTSILD